MFDDGFGGASANASMDKATTHTAALSAVNMKLILTARNRSLISQTARRRIWHRVQGARLIHAKIRTIQSKGGSMKVRIATAILSTGLAIAPMLIAQNVPDITLPAGDAARGKTVF